MTDFEGFSTNRRARWDVSGLYEKAPSRQGTALSRGHVRKIGGDKGHNASWTPGPAMVRAQVLAAKRAAGAHRSHPE